MLQILFLRCFDLICSRVKVHVCTTITSEEKTVNTDFHYVFTSTSNTIICCRFLRFAHICTKLNFMFANWSKDGKLIYLLHVYSVANVQKVRIWQQKMPALIHYTKGWICTVGKYHICLTLLAFVLKPNVLFDYFIACDE